MTLLDGSHCSRKESEKTMFQGVHRLALRTLYLGWRMKSRVFGGTLRGAVAALWVDEKLLLVQQSYRRLPMLPGGAIDKGETPEGAVIREIREELGVVMEARDLTLAMQGTWLFESRQEQVWLFEGTLPPAMSVAVDGREIISVSIVAPSEILTTRAGPPYLLDYLASRS